MTKGEHRMRICLVGNVQGNIDEGMKKISFCIYSALSPLVTVRIYSPLDLISKWQEIRKFHPDIIHYLTGPSIFSFFLLWVTNKINRNIRTIITISHPQRLFSSRIISLLKPNLVLVQSEDMKNYFSKIGIKNEYFPNGVDIIKFSPVDEPKKIQIRKELGVDLNKFIILHVGNLRKGRNLVLLRYIAQEIKGVYVVVVSSTSIKSDNIEDSLSSDPKIQVISNYVEEIEKFYQLADCYVFTVLERPYAIDLPLSVLEAAACNLPIVTTRYCGVSIFFEENPFFLFSDSVGEMVKKVSQIKIDLQNKFSEIRNRDGVIAFSWKNLASRLVRIYQDELNK